MGAVRSDLLRDEEVIYEASLHWFMFVTPVLGIVAGIAVAVFGQVVQPPETGMLVSFGGLALAGLSLLTLLGRWLTLVSTEFVVTNKRVVAKTGLLRRTTVDVRLSKIDAVYVDQSILGRILGYGTVVVSANTNKDGFFWIADPSEIRRQVHECQTDPVV